MAARRKNQQARREEYSTYIVEVVEWGPSYLFSLNKEQFLDVGPYKEYFSFEGRGKVTYPPKLAEKSVELSISGDRQMIDRLQRPEKFSSEKPLAVGSVFIRGDQSQIFLSLPFDSMSFVGSLFQAGIFKYMVLYGEPLRYGKAMITSFHFEVGVNLEDYT